MTTNLTATTSSTSITNNQPSAASRCGLNETGICCKESETAQSSDSETPTSPPASTPNPLRIPPKPTVDAPGSHASSPNSTVTDSSPKFHTSAYTVSPPTANVSSPPHSPCTTNTSPTLTSQPPDNQPVTRTAQILDRHSITTDPRSSWGRTRSGIEECRSSPLCLSRGSAGDFSGRRWGALGPGSPGGRRLGGGPGVAFPKSRCRGV